MKDVVVGRPEPVREKVLLEMEPDALDGVRLGRVGRHEDEGEIGWDAQASAGVPAGAVEDDEGPPPPAGGVPFGSRIDRLLTIDARRA